jgi:CBS domain-containing protein
MSTQTTVREHMTPHVVSVTEDTSLEEILKTLRRLDVSCVVVTAKDESAVGCVSLTDLARVSHFETGPRGARGPLAMMPPDMRAKDIMKAPLITIDEDADVKEAAAELLRHRIHRIFVTRAKKVVGVFASRDALRVVLFRHMVAPLSSAMSKPVETIVMGEPIDDAVARLDDANVRGLVVLDGTWPIGIFTQLEAIRGRALSAELRRHPVEEIMSYESINLDGTTPLYRAAGQAIATKVRRIIVVDGRKVAGIVTGYDLAQILL